MTTVAERGISAAASTISALPLAGAQPLTYDFGKRYRDAVEFSGQNNSSEAIDVLLEILEKAKGFRFAPGDLFIPYSQAFLASLYAKESRVSAAEEALKSLDKVFANKASWNPETITSKYKNLAQVLNYLEHSLQRLIPSTNPMRQNIKEKLTICEEELKKRLSENELEELRLFPSKQGYREVPSPLGIFACLVLTAVVYAIFFRSLSTVKIN